MSYQVESVLKQQANTYIAVAALTAVSYNFVLTLTDEITFVWKRKWRLGTFIYFITKYLSIACLIINTVVTMLDLSESLPEGVSIGIPPLVSILGDIVLFTAMILLQLRVYAIYEKNVTSNDGINAGYAPRSWIPGIIMETATFGLVVYKIWKDRDAFRHDRVKQATLLELIIRGNVFYFIIILLVYLIGACLSLSERVTSSFWNGHYVASVSISGIIASKLFIALKKDFLEQLEPTSLPSINSAFFAWPGDSI
ncbi:hypothetical protein DFH11DRAFT_103561 [Phellopilus nigrolimitatus]|nr:hypothetical protein DFH11DRAFT_103561 [Phellopilus nigrolimitatus]